nr:MAG TPA_asm: hypothetical protein [Caudoviricetes sp.]
MASCKRPALIVADLPFRLISLLNKTTVYKNSILNGGDYNAALRR